MLYTLNVSVALATFFSGLFVPLFLFAIPFGFCDRLRAANTVVHRSIGILKNGKRPNQMARCVCFFFVHPNGEKIFMRFNCTHVKTSVHFTRSPFCCVFHFSASIARARAFRVRMSA